MIQNVQHHTCQALGETLMDLLGKKKERTWQNLMENTNKAVGKAAGPDDIMIEMISHLGPVTKL